MDHHECAAVKVLEAVKGYILERMEKIMKTLQNIRTMKKF
jgi:hypothetical protein